MADKVGYVFLFLSLVAVIVAIGVLVGILVAGRIDRLQTSRPGKRPDDGQASATPPDAAEDEQA